MKTLHRITGILISVFVFAHLFNHCIAYFGIENHQRVLEQLRYVYRIPLVEVILIGAFVFQGISGILLFVKLWRKKSKSTFEKIKIYSGFVLGVFIIQHVSATLGQRLYFDLDTNFYFAAQVVLEAPFLYYFIPYYFLGVMSFGIHLAAIHREKVAAIVGVPQAKIHFWIIILLFFIVALFILYIFCGGLFEIVIPDIYKVF